MTGVLWHVTPRRHVPDILREGLKAQIGPRARAAGERLPCVYCFTSASAIEQALLNWMADEFEDTELSLLELKIPFDWVVVNKESPWEARVERNVPPQNVRLLFIDMDSWNGEYPSRQAPAQWNQ